MSQPPSSENPKESASDQSFYSPRHYSHGDYYSEISDNETPEDENSDNDAGDWDSFGDLILFI